MRWPWRKRERQPVTLDNYHEADTILPSDPAWDLLGRVMKTGKPMIGIRNEDGSWTVMDLPDDE